MTTLIILIIILFPVGILLRKKFPNLCALCFATASAWILGLLYILLVGNNELVVIDNLSLGILMGGSVVGSMYYLSSRLSEKYFLFKLPYFLSLLVVIYFVLSRQVISSLLIGVIILWVIFVALYVFRNNQHLKSTVKRIVECCKNW